MAIITESTREHFIIYFAWKAKNGVQVELLKAYNSHTEVFIHLTETKMIGGSETAKAKDKW